MRNIFEDLFVLELANNHWGSLSRGLRIVSDYSKVVRFNNVRAAIKLQFRNVPTFIHGDFWNSDERYIKKTRETALTREDFQVLLTAVKQSGCLTMATPFDEEAATWCKDLDLVKLASSDVNDWFLIEAVAKLRRPTIASTAGSSLKDLDDLVTYFEHRDIPLAINHCVALYPAEDAELDLNQIDFLRGRYPGHTIGLSTHEYTDWTSSLTIAYAKGARTFERHVDIDLGDHPVSAYCSLPHQIDEWFKAFKKTKKMCGADGATKRIPSEREIQYLDKLVRGAYARRELAPGSFLTKDDLYFAIPLQKGQLSSREMLLGQWGHKVLAEIKPDQPVMIDSVDTPYGADGELKKLIYERGL
jgi:N-acetylneuraminate synthase